MKTSMDRRTFVKVAGGAAGLVQFPGVVRMALAADAPKAATASAAAPNAADIIAGKSAKMIVYNAKLGVMATPLDLLRDYHLTPPELLYNRVHFPVEGEGKWMATVTPADADVVNRWTIDVGGLVRRPKTIRLTDVMQMPQEKRVSVMQCAGNGRSYYWAKAKTPGSGWQHGGMGNLEWEGVPLLALLDSLDLGADDSVRYLTMNGKDVPPVKGGSDMIKSVPLVAPQVKDAILAVRMNGKPIPTIHGGPVRVIVPGYYGNMNVKWITTLSMMPEETPSALMQKTYRMPIREVEPGKFTTQDLTQQNSDPTYGFRIMSVVFAPLDGQTVKAGNVELQGVAWNDGIVSIAEVRVSVDQGRTWLSTELDEPDGPYAWYRWRRQVKLPPGSHEVWVRATDGWGRSQPLDGLATWNPGGWSWHGVDRVRFAAA